MRLPLQVLVITVLSLFLLTPSSAGTHLAIDAQYPLFTFYIGVDDDNPARVAFSGMIRDSLRQVGIDAQVAIGTWGGWLDRFLFPNVSMLGAIYIDGGWDSVLVGWNWNSPWINPAILYSNDSIPYFNYCLINDSQVELLLDCIRQELDPVMRIQYQKALQARTHELSALLILHYVFPEPFAGIPTEFYFMLFVAGVIVLFVTALVYLQVRRHRPGIFTNTDR